MHRDLWRSSSDFNWKATTLWSSSEKFIMGVRSDWESLAPEILALVLQRVHAGCGQTGEGRRILAVAGVCRSWRQLVLQQETQSVFSTISPLIRFPAAIRKRPPLDCPLLCVLKKKGNSFFLFQSFQSLEGVNEEYLLLGARKRYLPSSSSFELCTDVRSLAKERASGSVASVKSNFARSVFKFADHESSAPGTTPLCVKYSEDIVAGVRQRKLSCGLQPVSSGSNMSPARAPLGRGSAVAKRSYVAWNCFLKTRRYHSTLSHNEEEEEEGRGNDDIVLHEKQLVVEGQQAEEGTEGLAEAPGRLSLKSKAPEWNQERGCWSLDFKGRATMASIHNFQLISSDAASPERVVLQLGKVGKGVYIVDVCSPLSALEAFSICLTSFAAYAGLEH